MAIMENNSDHFYNFKQDLDDNKKEFENIIKDIELNKDFELWGEDYKKFYYEGENKDLRKWYSKKNLFLKINFIHYSMAT